jgi:hypothetical protein
MDLIDSYSSDEATEGEVYEQNQVLSVRRGCVQVISAGQHTVGYIRANYTSYSRQLDGACAFFR